MSVTTNVLACATAIILASGCASAQLNRFREFSRAGSAYATVLGPLVDDAGRAAVETDGLIFLSRRSKLSEAARSEAVIEHDRLLQDRLRILKDLKQHAGVLRQHFESLALLADADTAAAVSQAIGSLAMKLEALGRRLGESELGGGSIATSAGTFGDVIILQVRSRALAKELRTRQATIRRELGLQKLVLERLAGQKRDDAEAERSIRELEEVVRPFMAKEPLPDSWMASRLKLLQPPPSIAVVEDAAAAAARLNLAFDTLLRGGLEEEELASIMGDLQRIADAVNDLKEKPNGGQGGGT